MLKIWKLPFCYAQLLTNEQSCLRAVCTEQNSASSETITSLQPIDSREVKLYKCYTPVSERQPLGPKQVSTRAAHHLVEALAVCPSQPQESSIRKHCLNQAPCSVLSARACHLPQLVLFFHSKTVGPVNSSDDWNRNSSSETVSWKPANPTCKTNEPVRFTTALTFRLTSQTLGSVLRHVWPTDFPQLSKDVVVRMLYQQLASPLKLFMISNTCIFTPPKWLPSNSLSCQTLLGVRDVVCMKWDEWVGELCVGMCVRWCACPKQPTLWLVRWGSSSTRSRMIQMLEDHLWPTWL